MANTAASIAITTPGGPTNANMLTLSGTAAGLASGVLSVYDNGIQIGSAAVSDGQWWTLVTPTVGANAYTATGTAQTDQSVSSNSVTVTALRTPPVVTIDQATGETGQPGLHLSGTASTPGRGETYVAGTTVTLDDNGAALGSAVVGSDGRWSADITLPTTGSNYITASDTDQAGNVGAVHVEEMFKTALPTIAINTGGGPTNASIVFLSGTTTASDPGQSVTISEDGTAIGQTIVAADGSWWYTAPLDPGPHTFQAATIDGLGHEATSNSLALSVVRLTPIVTFDQSDGRTSQPGLRLSGSATTPGSGPTYVRGTTISLTDNGLPLGSAVVGADGLWSAEVALPVIGDNEVEAEVTDLAGNVGESSISELLKTTTPTIAITSGGGPTNGTVVALSGTTTSSVAGDPVTIVEDGTAIGQTMVEPDGTWHDVITPGLGSHTFQVTTSDGVGHSATSNSVTVTGLRTPPVITIDQAGGETGQPGLHLSGTVTTPGLGAAYVAGTTVRLSDNNSMLGSALVGSDGRWSADVTLPTTGLNAIEVSDTDQAGNVAEAGNLNEVLAIAAASPTTSVAGSGPSVGFEGAPQLSGPTTATLSGTVSDAAGVSGVEIFQGGDALGAAQVNGDGTWTFSVELGVGTYDQLSAVATDTLGLSTTTAAPYNVVMGASGRQSVGEITTMDGTGAISEITTIAADGSVGAETVSNGDGSATSTGYENGQGLFSIGNDVMTGNGFREDFVFQPTMGHARITDFVADGQGHDRLTLSHQDFASIAQVLSNTTMSHGAAVIHVSPDDTIRLAGVTKADLAQHRADFSFSS